MAHTSVFPFLKLSGEVRNHIYRDIVGPKLSRPVGVEFDSESGRYSQEVYFWPDRKFNTALFFLNRQINREFSDILWDTLGVEWKHNYLELDNNDLTRLAWMNRLQRCKLIIEVHHWRSSQTSHPISYYHTRHPIITGSIGVESTVFGLAHKLNRMPRLKELQFEYHESDTDSDSDIFLRYHDGSLVRLCPNDLKTVFGDGLRGMKKVQMSGTLCCECAALVASAMERPKEVLSDLQAKEPDRCIPRRTTPQWSDKHRGWI